MTDMGKIADLDGTADPEDTVDPMHLQVVTPSAVVVDRSVSRVTAESTTGSFTMLPRHVDYVAVLVPGLLDYVTDGEPHTMAVGGGVLVKCGRSVRIATSEAAEGDTPEALQRALRMSFEELAEGERRSRAAIARLETDAIRRLIALSDHE